MTGMINNISSILLLLSAASAASAAVMFFKYDIRGYRKLVKNGAYTADTRVKVKTTKEPSPEAEKEEPVLARHGTGTYKKTFTARVAGIEEAEKKQAVSAKDEEGDSVTENLDEWTKKSAAAASAGTAVHDDTVQEELTSLQDGSDDTTYLKKTDVKKMQEKRDNTLWMDPAVKFRVTGGALIVHTDTEISEIMAAMCG